MQCPRWSISGVSGLSEPIHLCHTHTCIALRHADEGAMHS